LNGPYFKLSILDILKKKLKSAFKYGVAHLDPTVTDVLTSRICGIADRKQFEPP